MSSSKTEKRRTVNMNEEIAEELNRVANTQGKTLYSLINELASVGIEAHRLGFSLKEAVENKNLLNRVRKARLLLVNQDLWYTASDIAYKKNKDEWLSQAYEKAKWYGRIFLDNSSEDTLVKSLGDVLHNLFWDCNEVSIQKESGDTVSMRVFFTPEMLLQHTTIVERMIEGLLNTSGYAILRHMVEPGYIALIFKRVPLPEELPS